MVSTLMHFIWGYIGYSLAGYDPQNYILLVVFLFLTQFLDIDFILKPIFKLKEHHRYYFHNIFSIMFFLILFTFAIKYFFALSYLYSFIFVFLAFFLHITLDLFDEVGVPLLYPFKKKRYLIYKLSYALPFPIKLVYGGNTWFLVISISLFALTISINHFFN